MYIKTILVSGRMDIIISTDSQLDGEHISNLFVGVDFKICGLPHASNQ